MREEISALKSQIQSQQDLFASLASKVHQNVLEETKFHFNAFCKNMETAFVKEQAANRKNNLIFSGVPESHNKSDFRLINDLCSSSLGLRGVGIVSAYRMGSTREGTNYIRPIMVNFRSPPDRARVWQAKKRLKRPRDSQIWIHEDTPKCLQDDLRILLRVAKHAGTLGKEEYDAIRVRDYYLIYKGTKYNASELEHLPLEIRPSTLCTARSEDSLAFFGKHSPFSNHHPSPFSIKGTSYATVEQYLAVAKAKMVGDKEQMDKALSQPNPLDSKSILNHLRDSNPQEWQEQSPEILTEALRGKFRQNENLASALKKSHPLSLGEASTDPTWGIGFKLNDRRALTQAEWNLDGNLLGRALMEIRRELLG